MAQFTDNGPLLASEQDDRSYRHITLPNQLQVLLIHDPTTEKASAALDTRVGCMSDPSDTQGIAHFLEHMLFMGTEKYPDENEYSKFLSAHGGASNAYTDSEDTVYYFDVNQEHFPGALDRFAQFFIAPLFTESATNREMNAVDSENAKNQQSDVWRFMQLKKSLARPDHPFHNFGTGNLETLKDLPTTAGINLRDRLLEFHATYYSANQMRLVVLGKQSLDDLTQLVVDCFTAVPNKDIQAPKFDPNPYTSLGVRLEVVPVKDSRKLEITWPTPSIEMLFDSKPMNYLSHLIGHEGPGSILSLLKAKGWANGLSAGSFVDGSSFGVFGCQVDCTDEGIANADGIVEVIYQYIAMLKSEGPKEWVFNESRDISAMNFRFKSKSKPINYVVSCVTGMHIYPPAKTLSAGSLFSEFDPDAINMVLNCLTPKNMILMVCSRTFEGKTDKEERWYKTAYSMNELSTDVLDKWSNLTNANTPLRLPDPNDFIATDFTLVPPPASMPDPEAPPKRVFSDELLDVWYKHFGAFDKPKANMMVAINTPSAYDSPRNMVLTNLYGQMCEEELNEFSYAADIAGCRFDIAASRKGLQVDVFGYSHKLPVLLQQVADTVASPKLDEAMFERLKDKLAKTYANFAYNQPYQHAMFQESLAVETPRWNYPDRIAALAPLTVQNLRDFKATLLGRAKLIVLMHGNSSPEAAVEACKNLVTILNPKPLFESCMPSHARVVELPAQATCISQRSVENPAETNSGLEVVFQIGQVNGALHRALKLAKTTANEPGSDIVEVEADEMERGGSYRSLAVINLLMHLIKEPFFDDLRTKQQLGYLVFSGSMRFGDGFVVAARFLLQSEVKDPNYLDGRVEAFLLTFRDYLVGKTEANPEGLSDEEFAENVAAVVESLLEKHKNLNEETAFLWTKIEDDSFDFERKKKEAKAVATVTREEVVAFFDAYMGLNSPWRRKLSVRIHGCKHPLPGQTPPAQEIATDAAAAATTEDGAAVGATDEIPAEKAAVDVLSPVPQVPGPVVIIDEPLAFQRTRPLYAFRPAAVLPVASL